MRLKPSVLLGALLFLIRASSEAMVTDVHAQQISDKLPEYRCPGIAVVVTGASNEERRLICAAAKQADGLFGQCGLTNTPLIQVQIQTKPPHVCGVDAFASFDAQSQSIKLVNKAACHRLAISNPAYSVLPFADFYKSLVVHEIAHQIFRSHLKGKVVSRATHEYVAYAIQIVSMPQEVRTQFLERVRRGPTSNLDPFVDMVLLMSPTYFAAMAYDHFSAPGHGCRILQGVLRGTIEFPTNDLLE